MRAVSVRKATQKRSHLIRNRAAGSGFWRRGRGAAAAARGPGGRGGARGATGPRAQLFGGAAGAGRADSCLGQSCFYSDVHILFTMVLKFDGFFTEVGGVEFNLRL